MVAGQTKIALPSLVYINSEVSIGGIENGFGIAVKLAVSVGDMDKTQAQALIEKAHQVCLYSYITRGNIEVDISVIEGVAVSTKKPALVSWLFT
jgi:organic hydroperoxide reductase OsmC/OhrA